MNEIIIDEEFKHLMPPLGAEARAQLAENLQKNGCLHALVLWGNILIDGYNRFEICTKHNIPFSTVNMELPSREAAKLWIIELQAGRRNLTPTQLTYMRGLHYRTVRKLVGNDKTLKNQGSALLYQNDTIEKNESTRSHLAEKYKVSAATIMRDARISEAIDAIGEVSQEAKKTVLADEVKIEKKTLEKLAAVPKEELAEIAESIENGTYKKPEENEAEDRQPARTYAETSSHSAHPLIWNITGKTWSDLITACDTGSKDQIRKAFRLYIDSLERLYWQM